LGKNILAPFPTRADDKMADSIDKVRFLAVPLATGGSDPNGVLPLTAKLLMNTSGYDHVVFRRATFGRMSIDLDKSKTLPPLYASSIHTMDLRKHLDDLETSHGIDTCDFDQYGVLIVTTESGWLGGGTGGFSGFECRYPLGANGVKFIEDNGGPSKLAMTGGQLALLGTWAHEFGHGWVFGSHAFGLMTTSNDAGAFAFAKATVGGGLKECDPADHDGRVLLENSKAVPAAEGEELIKSKDLFATGHSTHPPTHPHTHTSLPAPHSTLPQALRTLELV